MDDININAIEIYNYLEIIFSNAFNIPKKDLNAFKKSKFYKEVIQEIGFLIETD